MKYAAREVRVDPSHRNNSRKLQGVGVSKRFAFSKGKNVASTRAQDKATGQRQGHRTGAQDRNARQVPTRRAHDKDAGQGRRAGAQGRGAGQGRRTGTQNRDAGQERRTKPQSRDAGLERRTGTLEPKEVD